ncbi:MAG: type II CAAX endopeptidase family protein [Candidatus Melainabacteria bacterium]|nr:type II CAAX endopeptidase family protein [Candidatus Melainabacteria bacterium]
MYTTIEARKGAGNEVFVESDKAEMSLRMTSSFVSLKELLKGNQFEDQLAKCYVEAGAALDKAIKLAPESSILLTKRIILDSETSQPIKKDLEKIHKIDTPKAKNLAKVCDWIYAKKKIGSEVEYKEAVKIIKTEMTAGWFQDVLNVQVEKAAGHKKKYEKELSNFLEHYKIYLIKLALFMVTAAICGFVGVIVIIVQLFMLPRKPTSDAERAEIMAPVPFGGRVVYTVFIAWLSTEYLVVPLLKGVSGDLANIATERGAFVVALLTAALYLMQNLPSIFYIWFFAFRHHGVKFLDGIHLRFKTERRGLIGLVMAGVLTWFAAIPLVMVAGLVAQKFGSQGSSNPIVAVVLSSVKEANPLAIIMFLITLGVLPALCEETLFRGFLYTNLRRKFGAFLSIIFSAALFSLAHFDPGGALPLFVLGALFAFVFERTKSLVPAMVAHCMWNSGTFLIALTVLG